MIRIKETVSTSNIQIAGQSALNSSALGTGVTDSSLTKIGTVTQGTWTASVIAGEYGGTGVNNQGKTITLAGNLTTQGAYPITIIATGATEFTLPTSGTLATADNTQTYTNKTFNLAAENNNTLIGTIAEFNLALSDQDFATLAGTETLTNKTVNLSTASGNVLTGTLAEFNTALTDGSFASLAGSETLTNKTINLAANTVTGTIAQFNTALSDQNFATLAGTETLTNKTINLNSASGNTLTGTLTEFNSALNGADFASLSGTETLTNKTVNLANNTLTGTLAQFNTALTDGSFATLAGSETLTNKSIDLETNTLTGSIAEFNSSLESANFVTSNATTNDTTLPGDLKVVSNFEIDPVPHDTIGGTVVIQGNLDVKGNIVGTQGDNQKVYTATGAISAGDVVSLLPDGTVEVTQQRTNLASTNQGATASATGSGYAQVIYDPLNAKWFNFYDDGTTMGYQVGTVSGNSITWGSATTTWGVDTFPGDPTVSSQQTFSVAIRPSDGVMLMTTATDAGLYFLKLKWNSANSQIDILAKWQESTNTNYYSISNVYLPPYNKFITAYQRSINAMYAQSFEIGDATTHAVTNSHFSSSWLNGVTGGGGYLSVAQDFHLRFNPYNNKLYVLIDYYGSGMTDATEYHLIEVTLGSTQGGGTLSGATASFVDLGFTIESYNPTSGYGAQQGRRQFAFDGSILVIPGIANSNNTLQLIYAVDLSTSPFTTASKFLQVMSLSNSATHGTGGHCEFSTVDNHFFFTYYNTNDDTAQDFYNQGYYYNTLRVTGAGTGSLTLELGTAVSLAASGDNRQANLIAGGDYVMYRQDTESFLLNRQISTSTNAADWIGIAAEDIADTAEGLIDVTGSINKSQTNLIKDTVYFVNELGTLSTGITEYGMIGKAISTTDLQIFGNAASELSSAIDVDFSTNSPTTTSGLVLTSDGDKSYSFQPIQSANITESSTNLFYTDARVDARLASGSLTDVVISGNLQVNGTTTTINSTTLIVDDINITVANGSTNKAASDGAGITADLGSDGIATILYDATDDDWKLNKSLQIVKTENPELKLVDSTGSSGSVRYNHESETIAYQTWTITSEEYPAGFGFYRDTLNFLNNPEPNFFAYKTLANNPNVNYLYIKGVNKSSLISSSQASTLTSGGTITLTENETTYVVTSGGATPSEYIDHLFTTNGSTYTETSRLYPTEVQVISNVLVLESDKENISSYSGIQFKVDGDKKVSIDSSGNLNAYNNLNVTGLTTIDGDVIVNSDQITISSGGTGTNTTPYLILNSLAEGTSFPVAPPQPAGGVKWTHNGSELASVELSTGVLNNLEINSAAEINMSANTNVTGNLTVSGTVIVNGNEIKPAMSPIVANIIFG